MYIEKLDNYIGSKVVITGHDFVPVLAKVNTSNVNMKEIP